MGNKHKGDRSAWFHISDGLSSGKASAEGEDLRMVISPLATVVEEEWKLLLESSRLEGGVFQGTGRGLKVDSTDLEKKLNTQQVFIFERERAEFMNGIMETRTSALLAP